MHLTFLSHLARHVRKVIEEVRVIKEFIWHSHFLDGIMMCKHVQATSKLFWWSGLAVYLMVNVWKPTSPTWPPASGKHVGPEGVRTAILIPWCPSGMAESATHHLSHDLPVQSCKMHHIQIKDQIDWIVLGTTKDPSKDPTFRTVSKRLVWGPLSLKCCHGFGDFFVGKRKAKEKAEWQKHITLVHENEVNSCKL